MLKLTVYVSFLYLNKKVIEVTMSWDDGKHAKVNKVQITYDDVIYSIQVTYAGTALQSQRRGSVGPKTAEFTLGPDEYITSLSAYGKTLTTQEVITALTFTTNKGTYGPYGNKTGYQISAPEGSGKQIAGFLGTSGNVLNSIDVHYAPIPTGTGGTGTGGTGTGGTGTGGTGGTGTGGSGTGGTGTGGTGTGGTGTGGTGTGGTGTGGTGTGGSGTGSGAEKLDAQGGTGGTAWDDGSDHDGLTKITVRTGGVGVQYVQFDYVKAGQPKQGALRGVQGSRGLTRDFLINHPDEHLVSVEGWYDPSNVILGIQFKTNLKTSDYFGYEFDGTGTKFTLQVQDKKIIGFHGFASDHLNSIGAYFVPVSSTPTNPNVPPTKLDAKGGESGAEWDDGAHDDVKKVSVGQGTDGIAAVMFEYRNGSSVVIGAERGTPTMLGYEGFELASDEYITIVEGTFDKILGSDGLTRLTFHTNKDTYGPYGIEGSAHFDFKAEGHKITGFHGRAGATITAIGVYLAPLGTTPLIPAEPSKKLDAKGGDGGATWDDGAFDGVRKVSVGQAEDGIGAVKFVYNKGSSEIVGDEHGKSTLLGFEEFELNYPSEYITEVHGTCDTIFGSQSAIITMLTFKTNKPATYGPFGLTAGPPFELKLDGHKIVGFHGSAGDLLHKFGVHVLPIN
ncbi:jacalin-related lectin 34 [Raphanus sativus]|uniref:Jacalin-related lectin 34 n=1 Tax=Raphanus sativus TaxID=3726 RepID=A0A9W3DSL4_RAPSA|nr:jacalin-related lectin 34 [Raphanus sativus]